MLALADYRQYRSRLNPVLAPLLVPDPENIYRWRVQYECGCIEEQLATNDNVEWLLAHSHTDPLSRERLPAGQFLCERSAREHKRSPEPEQLIVGWIDREVKHFPPDPVEPHCGPTMLRCGRSCARTRRIRRRFGR